MNRNAGIALALVCAVTAAVRIPAALTPRAPVQAEAAKIIGRKMPAPKPAKAPDYVGGCTAYDVAGDAAPKDENRGAAKALLDKFFSLDTKTDSAPSIEKLHGVQYAIALAADPHHTNLSLIFDRQMAVVQQAAQDESYTYDSSWLPWHADEPAYPLLSDQQAEDDVASQREACPGMLLFRRSVSEPVRGQATSADDAYRGALVVLVVGEQPTGGLNEDQWENAILWLGRNAASADLPRLGEARPGASIPETAAEQPILRILGPSFSGSMISLGRDLARLYPPAGSQATGPSGFAAKFPEARVLSGSVTDCASIRWFEGLPWPRANDPSRPSVVFGSFEENDDRQIYNFLSYLKSQGTGAHDTAILSEDETAYSGSAGANPAASGSTLREPCGFPYASDNRPVRLFFPRDISALRNAYEKESIFASTTAGGGGEHSSHAILQQGGEQADDGGNPSDTIQAYSHHLTPLAQEAALYGIVSYLRAHHSRYLLLRCTNQLDFLFLTRFFHRAYPEGRIVTVGADLLFRREIDTTEFRGVLALTNYPLVPRNQHWSMLTERQGPLPGHAHRAFEAPTIEGAYVAARYLFSRGTELTRVKVDPDGGDLLLPLKESLPEYADPFWLHLPQEAVISSHAPTWLVVVGRDGYWPIAVLNDEWKPVPAVDLEKNSPDDPARAQPPSTMVRLTSAKAHYDRDFDGKHFNKSLRSQLPLAWTLCAGLALLLIVYQTVGIWLGDTNRSNGLFSVFRKVDAPSQDILLGCNSALATILLGALLGICRTVPWRDTFASADIEMVAFIVLGLIGVLAIGISLVLKRGAMWLTDKWFWKRGWLALFTYTAVLIILGWLSLATLDATMVPAHAGMQANAVPLFYRMSHLTSGVTPLLPVLFVLCGFYLWSWHAMAGNVLLCNGRPKLPMLADEPALKGRRRWYWILLGNPVDATVAGDNRLRASEARMSQKMGKEIVAMASPFAVPPGILFLPFCLLVGSIICFHKDLPLLTMEGHAFALWLNVGLLIAFLLIATEASRLFWTWIELRRLLAKLGRLRLRRTFARLPAIEASSLWGMSGSVQRVQYRFFSQQLEAAKRLAALSGVPLRYLKEAVDRGIVFDRPAASGVNTGSRWTIPIPLPSGDAVTIRDAFSDAVAEVINRTLLACWEVETESLNLATGGPSAGGDGDGRNVLDLALSADPIIRTAEEFVCFHYISFIQNILARMRTMALSMVLLFVAISLAISFYPFVPRTQVTMWMLVNLVLIGSAVIYVYAGMDRDEILSYISNSRPGRLSPEFWLKTAGFMAGPLIGIIATQFPAVADSVLGWVQPGLDAIK